MTGEALVQISSATVYQVERSTHAVTSIANGDFIVAYAAPGDDAGLEAQVGSVRWALGRWVATLRFDNLTYAFQLPPPDDAAGVAGAAGAAGGPSGAAAAAATAAAAAAAAGPAGHALHYCYFCLTLHPDTPLELIDLLQAVLASGTAYHDYEHLQQRLPPPQAAAAAPAPAEPSQAGGPRGEAPPGMRRAPAAATAGAAGAAGNADRIAAGIQRGGQLAAAGVLAAAAWAGAALQRGADTAVARMQPSDRHHSLSPEAQARLERARVVAAQAAEVSGRAVAGALSMTAQVAGHLAQRIAESDLGRKMSKARVAGASAQDLQKVGAASVDAAEAVCESLADAARIVLAHTRVAATRVACHKYGHGAAHATGAGMQVAQSVVEAGLNMYKLRPTALFRGTIKGTAKNVVLGTTNGNGANGGPAAAAAAAQAPPERSGASTSAAASAPPPPPPPPAAPVAAAISTLAALSAGPPPQHHGAAAASAAAAPYSNGGAAAAALVEGVPVTGPVVGQPVLVDYTPSVAAFQDATGAAGTGGTGQGLPYPAVSTSQYAARYYPAVPRV